MSSIGLMVEKSKINITIRLVQIKKYPQIGEGSIILPDNII